ncbi:MAG: hypothetical protein UU47_C0007G0014 [candidate division TM6 bacterium GW2011_GWE2_41_16]|nr:MAG: hypothetical protein UU47_C0007G0014 [candidate division TM6 bacterium GW2011_GWE2_41_16]
MSTQKKHVNAPLVVIEGNVGAGKSTFLRLIGEQLNAQLVFEPNAQWQDVDGENLLEKFYEDSKRWAYSFQTYVFITRVQTQQEAAKINTQPLQILERSVYSDRFCFAKNSYEMGNLSSLEWKMYCKWFAWLVDTHVQKPIAFIYLRTSPEVCFKRLHKRNRFEEVNVTLDYLQRLDKKHEDWLIHGKEDLIKNIPVLVLDNNKDFESNELIRDEHLCEIVTFFEKVLHFPAKTVLKQN